MNPAGAYGALDIYVFLLWEPNMLHFQSWSDSFHGKKEGNYSEAGQGVLACGLKYVVKLYRFPPHRSPTPTFKHQGGQDVWGNMTHAPDDGLDSAHSHGELISFRRSQVINDSSIRNMTADDASTWILQHTPSYFQVIYLHPNSTACINEPAKMAENDGNELLFRYRKGRGSLKAQ